MPGGIVLTAKHFASYFVLAKKYLFLIYTITIIWNTFCVPHVTNYVKESSTP